MKKFLPKYSVGYNFDFQEFFKVIKKYKAHIDSVYFPPPKNIIGSGRIIDESYNYNNELIGIINECKKLKITPFLLLNSTTVSVSQIKKIVEYIKILNEKHGLKHVTVTDPYLIIQLKKSIPSLFIEASTLCRVKNVFEAKYFKELGVSRITSDREIIRDINSLKHVKSILPIKVLANEACMKNCIYKYSHYNMLSQNKLDEPFFSSAKKIKEIRQMHDEMDSMCTISISKYPYKFFQSPFIRPEDIKYYKDVSSVFKLSTRNFETKRIEKTLNAYINQSYDGNLVEILNTSYIDKLFEFIDNKSLDRYSFFNKLSTCDDNCDKCGFCKTLIKEAKVKLKTTKMFN